MDIFNRPASISEDTLQYTLYPSLELASSQAECSTLVAQIHAAVESLLPSTFIWHRDAFELKVVSDEATTSKWKLEGRMRIGDSVDDEWCVVWLLRELTKALDVAVRYVACLICFIVGLILRNQVCTIQMESSC